MAGTRLLSAARRAVRTGEDAVRPVPVPTVATPERREDLIYPEPYPVLRPRDVLPHPDKLVCMVAWDTETSGLFVDDGARTAVISVAYCTKDDPDEIIAYAFPFDQGRASEKGYTPVRDKFGQLKVDNVLRDKRRKVPLVTWDGLHVPRGFGVRGKDLCVDLDAWCNRDVNLGRQDWDDLLRWLRLVGEAVGLTGHNDKYDLHVTETGTRAWPGTNLEPYVAWDSMLAAKILWPLESIALKQTAGRLWGREEAEEADEVKRALAVAKVLFGLKADDGARYDLLPWDVIGPYATQDAVLTLKLTRLQTDMIHEGEAVFADVEDQMDLMRTLWRMEHRGFGPLDVERTTKVAEAIEARIAHLENALPFDPPTAYKAKEYFFDELGLAPWKGAEERRIIEMTTGKKGQPVKKVVKQGSLTVDVCGRMAAQGVPFAAEMAELMRLKTANQMHYRGYVNLAGPDNRLRTSYRQAFVRSGRMSVERFQAQAIPRRDSVKIAKLPGFGEVPHPRDLFLTPEGRRRATIDLSQAELRVAAQFSGCKRMIEQVREGRDIHGEMATQIFGVQPGDDDFTHYRYISKRGVFGGIFMVGPKTFRETIWKLAQLDLPYAVCKQTIDGFRNLYPEIEQAYLDSQSFVQNHGYVELVDGSRSYFGAMDYDNTAWNRRVQGSLAKFNAAWLVEVERRTQQWDALVLTVHDSVTLDLPEDEAPDVVAEIQKWTAAEFERWFGIVGGTDVEWGY